MSFKLPTAKVLHPGIGCSIQDKGRLGYMSNGIPISGAMDLQLAGIANLLLGNSVSDAVIEWKLIPPILKFTHCCEVVIAATNVVITLNSIEQEAFKLLSIPEGAILHLKLNAVGGYGYMAIKSGFQTANILRSRSFYKNITKNSVLTKNMLLPYIHSNYPSTSNSKLIFIKTDEVCTSLEVTKGPEFSLLSHEAQQNIGKRLFSINNQSNRMGYTFNEFIMSHKNAIISSPVLPGTVQWTPSGKLIVLMRDAQTVGGYPRILQLKELSISKLSRVAVNGFVKFIICD